MDARIDLSYLNKDSLISETDRVKVWSGTYYNDPVCCQIIKFQEIPIEKVIQEVNAIWKINHSGTIKVIWAGYINETEFLILQELLTNDLEKEIKLRKAGNRLWSEVDLVRHLGNMIDVLATMQDMGYSHRDIKPQNILITQNRELKLMNFGNAKDVTGVESLTIAGTPGYLSPELRLGWIEYIRGINEGKINHNAYKSDVYSLGLTFLYMATFQEINQSSSEEIIQRVQMLPFQSIQAILYYMLIHDSNDRPDFIWLRSLLWQNNLLTNVLSVITNSRQIFKNVDILNQLSVRQCKYKVMVSTDNLNRALNRYWTHIRDNQHINEKEKVLLTYLLSATGKSEEIWKIRNICCKCGCGLADIFCRECKLGVHSNHRESIEVKSSFIITTIYKCNNQCPGFHYFEEPLCHSSNCNNKSLANVENQICRHVFCEPCWNRSDKTSCMCCWFPYYPVELNN